LDVVAVDTTTALTAALQNFGVVINRSVCPRVLNVIAKSRFRSP